MKFLLAVGAAALISSSACAGEAFSETYYKNKNWSVLKVGLAGGRPQCAIRSKMDYLDDSYRKAGAVYLEVSYPKNKITLSGDGILMYFKISKGSKIQVGSGKAESIIPEAPMDGSSIVDGMLISKAKDVRVEISFGDDNPSIHKFPISGFPEAYKKLQACSDLQM